MTAERIAEEYGSQVSAICRRMITNRALAEEAAQESWLEILRSLPSFRKDSKISTWIFTITRRTVLRYLQDEKLYSPTPLGQYFDKMYHEGMDEFSQIPDSRQMEWIRLQCDDCLTAILHCLENQDRLLLLFRIFSPLCYKELSVVFEKEEAALRKSFSRSSRKIRNFMNKQCFLFNPDSDCKCKLTKPMKYSLSKHRYDAILESSRTIMDIKKLEDFYKNENFCKIAVT